jgi:hypothetical protein
MMMAICEKIQQRFWSKVAVSGEDECWPWTGAKHQRQKYGFLRIAQKNIYSHRVAYCIANGLDLEQIQGFMALHSCDNPSCNNPKHLRLGTAKDNMDDKHKRGRAYYPAGEKCPQSKLSKEEVLEIRKQRAEGQKLATLGEKFGVDWAHISMICRRKTWKHV